MPSKQFDVKFASAARTLEYKDEQGELVFTFDLGSAGDKSLSLEHYSPQMQRAPRYRLAIERTREFLESCGYQVEITGEFAAPNTATASDVTVLIEAQLAGHQLPRFPDIRNRLLAPKRSEFHLHPENTIWDMWLVFEEPVHGFRIVFDEHSKQFGVAQGDIFHGFYGNFIQTLDAISGVGS